MKEHQKELLQQIANDYNVTNKSLHDLISSAKKFSYENTTAGQRQSDYLGIIKHAINNGMNQE